MLWIVVAPEREQKQMYVAKALRRGIRSHGIECDIIKANPPETMEPFIAMGQVYGVGRFIPKAMESGRAFWHVDNGFYKGSGIAGGGDYRTGHYRFTYRSFSPILLQDYDRMRYPAERVLEKWRPFRERTYVLIGIPGPTFGQAININVQSYIDTIEERVRAATKRKVVVRQKWLKHPTLEEHMSGAHVLVTHSSNIAVDAVVRGIPTIVEPTCPTAPISSSRLEDIDNPPTPNRKHWWGSLMSQQFTADEMSHGLCWTYMRKVKEQVDGHPLSSDWLGELLV